MSYFPQKYGRLRVAEASALAISLILYLSSTQLVRLWCVCGYHLYGAHMMQLVKDALKFLKEEVPLTGYLIVDYFPYRTTSVGLLDVKRDISCIYLLLTEDIEWFTFVSVLQYDHVVGTSSGSLYCLYVLGASEQQNCREGKFRIVEKENSDGYAKEVVSCC
ncbi:hypothetical protein MUK42_33008 [Musa troglodytarum]|uniref:Uncharacterized protein n=1 Tax=Musa troglodytarum TaxID=320322 RepID=A0A9E7JPE1_9LILI|nr:hypothetical protein MUK42_33008 [Musa troglodytarum]